MTAPRSFLQSVFGFATFSFFAQFSTTAAETFTVRSDFAAFASVISVSMSRSFALFLTNTSSTRTGSVTTTSTPPRMPPKPCESGNMYVPHFSTV